VSRQLKDGQIVSYSYHYPGILDEQPHVKLGKSVFGVVPGGEGAILDLFNSFDELTYYNFIGYVLESDCQAVLDELKSTASREIEKHGLLSILLVAAQHEGTISRANLNQLGFEDEYIDSAIVYLQKYDLVKEARDSVVCTQRGVLFAQSILKTL
jgi:hypothetical protein